MFRFVTKKELWDIEDSGLLDEVPQTLTWNLKSIQDSIAYGHLFQFENKRIAEIGGGNSRVLRALARKNQCVNIDKFEGAGGGPTQSNLPENISLIQAYLGKETKELIQDDFFDALFSISVIEHIPNHYLGDLFQESARIVKRDALAIHLIDIYCIDVPTNQPRMSLLTDLFFKYFRPLEKDILAPDDIKFSCANATNPDSTMNRWNKVVPELRKVRETHQSCSLILAGFRV